MDQYNRSKRSSGRLEPRHYGNSLVLRVFHTRITPFRRWLRYFFGAYGTVKMILIMRYLFMGTILLIYSLPSNNPLQKRNRFLTKPPPTPSEEELKKIHQETSLSTDSELEERLLKVARANQERKILIFTYITSGTLHFTTNWLKGLNNYNYKRFLVICHDRPCVMELAKMGYYQNTALLPDKWLAPYVDSQFIRPSRSSDWVNNPSIIISLMKQRLFLYCKLLSHDFNLLGVDTDVVFLSADILTYLSKYLPQYDVMFQVDPPTVINTGFIVLKASNWTKRVMNKACNAQFYDVLDGKPKYHHFDQGAFNELLSHEFSNRYDIYSSPHTLPLDPLLFPVGLIWYELRQNSRVGLKPFIAHGNYFSEAAAKLRALKQHNLWMIE